MEITHARAMKNALNQVFDILSTGSFCQGVPCQNCSLFVEGGKCIPNKIQMGCKLAMNELLTFIEENDKCSSNQPGGGEPPP